MKIKNKLKSNNGASLLIALVFMMFCAFVGGALLASSTANAGRIAALKTEEQDFLSQRSAAMVIMDEMNLTHSVRFSVTTTATKQQTVYVDETGELVVKSETPVSTEVVISAYDSDAKPFMQRLLYETAVINYIKANNLDLNSVKLENFVFKNNDGSQTKIESVKDFLLFYNNSVEECVMNVKLMNNVKEPLGGELKAYFKCSANEENKYSMSVDFGDDSQLSIQMPAHITNSQKPQTTIEDNASGNDSERTVAVSNFEIIKWDAPSIVKGAMA